MLRNYLGTAVGGNGLEVHRCYRRVTRPNRIEGLGGNESRNTDVKSGMKRRKYQQPLAQSTFGRRVYASNDRRAVYTAIPYSAVSSSSCAGGGESMATAIWLSASLVLCATRKYKFTFPVFAVCAVLSNFLAITISLILDIAVPEIQK
jgi:hypothetical protein